jgi:hypothetical protein
MGLAVMSERRTASWGERRSPATRAGRPVSPARGRHPAVAMAKKLKFRQGGGTAGGPTPQSSQGEGGAGGPATAARRRAPAGRMTPTTARERAMSRIPPGPPWLQSTARKMTSTGCWRRVSMTFLLRRRDKTPHQIQFDEQDAEAHRDSNDGNFLEAVECMGAGAQRTMKEPFRGRIQAEVLLDATAHHRDGSSHHVGPAGRCS